MKDLKSKLSAIDDLIERCEDAIARPGKEKRMALIVKAEPKVEVEEKDDDMLDKKAKLSNMLDEMDEEELLKLYEQLED